MNRATLTTGPDRAPARPPSPGRADPRPSAVDPGAFREFFLTYEPRVRKFLRWCGVERRHEDDLVQLTMQEAFTYFSEVRDLEKPQHWLFRVARQRRARFAAEQRRHGEPLPPEDLSPPAFREGGYAAIEERDSPVFAALARLPVEQREAVVLRAFGVPYGEIAELQDIKVNSARSRVSRAHDALRGLLGEENERAGGSWA